MYLLSQPSPKVQYKVRTQKAHELDEDPVSQKEKSGTEDWN